MSFKGITIRFVSLIKRGIFHIRHYGIRSFMSSVLKRIFRLIPSSINPSKLIEVNSKNIYKNLYHSFLSTASNDKTDEFVPITETAFPINLTPVKLIAFYLPQFHPIPENDTWWGKGFTEWTNVSKATPQFVGHYQPHLPGELGFYDLRVPDVLKRQIELARMYGIYGFAFYYYWFNGKRLLEKPIDIFFSDKENNFPFCIFWANENWTRRWDGMDDDVLVAQNHSPESDLAFIHDIEPYLRDKRYIRIGNKPVLLVYRIKLLPNPAETARRWRKYCQEVGIGEIYLIAGQIYGFEDPKGTGFDAVVEFPPHNLNIEKINDSIQILNPNYHGHLFRYQDFANFYSTKKEPKYELYKTVSPNWDNEPRKPGRGFSITGSTPLMYQNWLRNIASHTMRKKKEKRIVFINAWNEWGEGAHLEPDRRFGYAYLQATRDAISSVTDINNKSILVFQMGKVGSTSVATSLSKYYPASSIYHVHWLNNLEEREKQVKKTFVNASVTLKGIQKGKSLKYAIDHFPSEVTWKVITMVRDPVAQDMSVFFQAIPNLMPNFQEAYENGEITLEILQRFFFNRTMDNYDWFNEQLKPVFEIDVLDTPFPFEQGYKIYKAPKARILLIRLEDMNRIIGPAMKDFLGIENFILAEKNKGEEKYYGDLYKMFRNHPLPKNYIKLMYSKPWVKHFYSTTEIESFKKYWLKQ